jgi:hypothetical protein
VFSFGVNHDESFDVEINKNHGCVVHSFDPFVETKRFADIRSSKQELSKSVKIPVNPKWTFYRLGITGKKANRDLSSLKLKEMIDFEQVLDLTNTRNKVVDVFKMDIEDGEISVLETIDMDYLCKYVKQFVLETHLNMPRQLLYKVEKCFYLFHRDTRFFQTSHQGPTGHLTEWQKPGGHSINVQKFLNELDLASFMFTTGELYFVNLNFVQSEKSV